MDRRGTQRTGRVQEAVQCKNDSKCTFGAYFEISQAEEWLSTDVAGGFFSKDETNAHFQAGGKNIDKTGNIEKTYWAGTRLLSRCILETVMEYPPMKMKPCYSVYEFMSGLQSWACACIHGIQMLTALYMKNRSTPLSSIKTIEK